MKKEQKINDGYFNVKLSKKELGEERTFVMNLNFSVPIERLPELIAYLEKVSKQK